MEQSPSWEVNCHLNSQEIFRLLWNPKVCYGVHKSPPLGPIMTHMNPIHIFPPYFSKNHSKLVSHLRLGLPSHLISLGQFLKHNTFPDFTRWYRKYRCITFRSYSDGTRQTIPKWCGCPDVSKTGCKCCTFKTSCLLEIVFKYFRR